MTDVTDDWTGAREEPHKPAMSDAQELKTFADGAASNLKSTIERVQTKSGEVREQVRGWTQDRSEQARDMIDERPITAVVAAFGFGLAVGVLLSR